MSLIPFDEESLRRLQQLARKLDNAKFTGPGVSFKNTPDSLNVTIGQQGSPAPGSGAGGMRVFTCKLTGVATTAPGHAEAKVVKRTPTAFNTAGTTFVDADIGSIVDAEVVTVRLAMDVNTTFHSLTHASNTIEYWYCLDFGDTDSANGGRRILEAIGPVPGGGCASGG